MRSKGWLGLANASALEGTGSGNERPETEAERFRYDLRVTLLERVKFDTIPVGACVESDIAVDGEVLVRRKEGFIKQAISIKHTIDDHAFGSHESDAVHEVLGDL